MSYIQLKALEKSNIRGKNYIHTDIPLSDKELIKMRNIVQDKSKMVKYRFGPFITFNIAFKKYQISNGVPKIKLKKRVISLANHHDSYIYRYYANLLNYYYNDYVKLKGFSNCSAAYRYRQGKSNITTAKEVFDFIVDNGDMWIFKGDFSSFFDNLNHSYLKNMVKKVLRQDYLEEDWYRVITSITKYRKIFKSDLLEAIGKKRKNFVYNFEDGKSYFKNRRELNEFIKSGNLKISKKNNVGIPQGTAISAVLANVYMIDFDEYIQNIMSDLNGLYRRYSDDFIICIPKSVMHIKNLKSLVNTIIDRSNKLLHLKIEKSKTKTFSFSKNTQAISLIDDIEKNSVLSYLGFTFDGGTVAIRPKSIYKFIYKSKRNINNLSQAESIWRRLSKNQTIEGCHSPLFSIVSKEYLNKHKFIIRRNIVKRYLSIPLNVTSRISMLSYAEAAQKIMEKENKYKVVIRHQVVKQIRYNQKRIAENRQR